MSALGAAADVPLAPTRAARPIAPPASTRRGLSVRLAAFAGLSAFAAWRFAAIETRPPGGRVVAITAAPIIAAAVLGLIRAPAQASSRTCALSAGARIAVLVALLGVALLVAGVPAHLLRPARWGRLAGDLRGGLDTLSVTPWPYAGSNSWARLDILIGLATALIAASAVAFWPAPHRGPAAAMHGVQQLGALGLLVTLYVTGVVNGSRDSSTVEGLVLLALVVAWLWLPGLRTRRLAAALLWLLAAGAGAAIVAGPLEGGRAWLDYRAWDLLGGAGPTTAFAWDHTYGPIGWSRSDRVMFTVKAVRPQLWKTTTLDRFDGLRFIRSGTDAASSIDLPTPVNDRWYTFVSFGIQGLSSSLVPIEQGTTVGVNFGQQLRRDRDGTTRTLGSALRSGDSYTVLSYVPAPTLAELRAAPRAFPLAYRRYTDFDLPDQIQSGLNLAATDASAPGRFFTDRTVGAPALGLPPAAAPAVQARILASPYGPMYRLARRLATGSHSAYDIAVAIENYLKANYRYSEQPPPRRYPLESFLFDDRIGYCQQFSGAMALMLRMDGIPARVASGFLPGRYDPATRVFTVRAVDAHSWVEVYFTGIGWVPFNPTPPRSAPLPNSRGFPSERSATVYDALAAAIRGPPPRSPAQRGGGAGAGRAAPAASAPLALILAAVAAIAAMLALVVWALAGGLRLRRSLGRDGELATLELVGALRALGYAIPATATLAQIEQRVSVQGGPEAARYVRLLRERRYGAPGGAPATLHDRRALRRALTAHLGLDTRLLGLWALPPATLGRRGRGQLGGPLGGP